MLLISGPLATFEQLAEEEGRLRGDAGALAFARAGDVERLDVIFLHPRPEGGRPVRRIIQVNQKQRLLLVMT